MSGVKHLSPCLAPLRVGGRCWGEGVYTSDVVTN